MNNIKNMNYFKKNTKMRTAILTLLMTVVFTQSKAQQTNSQSPTAKYNA